MKKRVLSLIVSVFLVVGFSGCSHFSKKGAGAVLGGAAGGAAGSQIGGGSGKTVATIVGTLAGAALGAHIGAEMDKNDRQQVGQALEDNKTGHTDNWTNPDTGHAYSVTPTRTYSESGSRESGQKQPCRDFTLQAKDKSGQPKAVHGTACRQPDGDWRIQS